MNDYPTPQALIAYLDGKRKAKGHFKDRAGGRCCLGHYADMCGLEYPANQCNFDRDYGWRHASGRASLPRGHWMLNVQHNLTDANDNHLGFDKVIEILRSVETP